MGCSVASEVDLEIGRDKKAQQYLIEYLLTYSEYDLKSLAEILAVNPLFLLEVLKGNSYLNENNERKLWDWFWLFISN